MKPQQREAKALRILGLEVVGSQRYLWVEEEEVVRMVSEVVVGAESDGALEKGVVQMMVEVGNCSRQALRVMGMVVASTHMEGVEEVLYKEGRAVALYIGVVVVENEVEAGEVMNEVVVVVENVVEVEEVKSRLGVEGVKSTLGAEGVKSALGEEEVVNGRVHVAEVEVNYYRHGLEGNAKEAEV